MKEKVEVDVIRRVYVPNGAGVFLEIRPWPDAPETSLEILTSDKESIDYFGRVSIVLPLSFAEALGGALLASALDATAKPKGEG